MLFCIYYNKIKHTYKKTEYVYVQASKLLMALPTKSGANTTIYIHIMGR